MLSRQEGGICSKLTTVCLVLLVLAPYIRAADTTAGGSTEDPNDLMTIALGKVSKKCQDAVTACTSMSEDAKKAIKEKKYCEVMSSPLSAKCLGQLGCSPSEVDSIKQTVCEQPKTTPATVETDLLKIALGKVSKKCQDAVTACTSLSEDAKKAIKEKKYCEVMSNPLAAKCFGQLGCSNSEVESIKTTVCTTPSKTPQTTVPVPETTKDTTDLLNVALTKVSEVCEKGLWACLDSNPSGKELVQEKKYCTVMSNPLAGKCLVLFGCTETEAESIKQTVCAQPITTPAAVRTDLPIG